MNTDYDENEPLMNDNMIDKIFKYLRVVSDKIYEKAFDMMKSKEKLINNLKVMCIEGTSVFCRR